MSKAEFFPVVDGKQQKYHIRPQDVPIRHEKIADVSTFGSFEVEQSAGALLAFHKAFGEWKIFTLTDLRVFYEGKGWDFNLALFGLVGYHCVGVECMWEGPFFLTPSPFLVQFPDGSYAVTNLFIDQCMHGPEGKAFLAKRK